jgi:hypothetical protein
MSKTNPHTVPAPDPDQGAAQKPSALSKLSSSWIYLLAFSYFAVVTVAFFVGKIDTHDFFTQTAVVLGGVGLYHIPPSGVKKAA